MNNFYIGLSLSICIPEMVMGEAVSADVKRIYTRTAHRGESLFAAFKSLSENNWSLRAENLSDGDFSRKCLVLAYELYNDGKIIQPRLFQINPWVADVKAGIWHIGPLSTLAKIPVRN